MTSNHHAPYDLGLTRTTMAVNRGKQSREVELTKESKYTQQIIVDAVEEILEEQGASNQTVK